MENEEYGMSNWDCGAFKPKRYLMHWLQLGNLIMFYIRDRA